MFPYRPLSESTNEIRLLRLLPADFHSPIHCELEHAELTENLSFTALSYTWGDPKICKTIFLDGYAFEVTVNLYDALQHMRTTNDPRKLWVDAVCINQKDKQERNKQVLRMRDIYANAVHVEVWLGRAETDDIEALKLVGELGTIVSDPEDSLATGFENYGEKFHEILERCQPHTAKALSGLFKRAWWTRIWVVQELSLAKQDVATVRCGQITLPWLSFLVTAYAIQLDWFVLEEIISSKFPDHRLDAFMQGIRMSQCRKVSPTDPGFTLLELLHQHRDCEATDPLDKVYGLLGFSADADDIGVKPDYNLSPEMVYSDLFRKHVNYAHSLDMICACRHPRNFTALPSWVPDWSTDQTIPGICINDRYKSGNVFPGSPIAHFQKYSASGTSFPRVSFFEDKMSVVGIHVGTIVATSVVDNTMSLHDVETFGRADENGKSGSDSEVFNQWLNLILDAPNWNDIKARYGKDSVLDSFVRTLVGDRNNQMMKPEGTSSEEDEARSQPPTDDQNQDEDQDGDSDRDSNNDSNASEVSVLFSPPEMLNMTVDGFRSCLQVSWGKRLAILNGGHIGLVPPHAIVGDHVVVFLGCTMPLVLHQIDDTRASFVGESYIHGVMDGEAMEEGIETTIILE